MPDRVRVPLIVRAAGTRKGQEFKGIDKANRALGVELTAHSLKTIRRVVKLEGVASVEIEGKTLHVQPEEGRAVKGDLQAVALAATATLVCLALTCAAFIQVTR